MGGIEKERRLQIGTETEKGTAVAATAIYRAPANSIKDDREIELPEENVGYFIQLDRKYTPALGASYDMPNHEATFEQIGYTLSASVKTVSGSGNGGTTNGYIYAYAAPTKAADVSFTTYTLEAGDNTQAYEMEYSYVDKWTLTGAPKKAVMLKSSWRGRQKTATTFTTNLTPPTVEPILFQKGKIYIDAVGGTMGSTQKTATWLGFTLDYDSGLSARYTGDGNKYFTAAQNTGPKITGKLTLEYDSVAKAMEDAFAAETSQLLRMEFTGAALTGTGGTHSTKLLRLDLPITITDVDELKGQDGNDTITLSFQGVMYSSTWATFTVVNTLAALA